MTSPLLETVADTLSEYREDLLSGRPQVYFPVGVGALEHVEIGPGKITLLGGAPGAGKTALAMQFVVDALRSMRSLKVVVCNVEMPHWALLDRQVARLSGVDGALIRRRESLAAHQGRIDVALATIADIGSRLSFLRTPYTLDRITEAAVEFEADLVLLDYLQRISTGDEGGDQRRSVNTAMSRMRQFAEAGLAVIVVAAVGRAKDAQGRSSYDGQHLNLASFRESSELEYGADDAYLLVPAPGSSDRMELRQVKSRYGEQRTIPLHFHRACQRFTPVETLAATSGRGD